MKCLMWYLSFQKQFFFMYFWLFCFCTFASHTNEIFMHLFLLVFGLTDINVNKWHYTNSIVLPNLDYYSTKSFHCAQKLDVLEWHYKTHTLKINHKNNFCRRNVVFVYNRVLFCCNFFKSWNGLLINRFDKDLNICLSADQLLQTKFFGQ